MSCILALHGAFKVYAAGGGRRRATCGMALAALLAAAPLGAQDLLPQGAEFHVNTYTTSGQLSASVSSDADGDFVVVWQSGYQDGASNAVVGQRYQSSGARRGEEFLVNTYTTSGQSYPSISSDADGDFVVVWESFGQDGNSNGVFGQRYESSGAPRGGEFRVNTATTNRQGLPSASSDADGDFVVVWTSYGQDGSDYGVFGQRYQSGGAPLGDEFRVNTYTDARQLSPSASSDADGDFVVVWTGYGQDGSGLGIFGQRYQSGGAPRGDEFRVNTYTTSAQRHASVSADADGDFVVLWTGDGQDGSDLGVFGQRYQRSGAPLDVEFRVNTYTTDRQRLPSASSDEDGDFVVVWTSRDQDGSNYEVFGQRFAPATPPATATSTTTSTATATTTPRLLPSNSGRASSALGLALLLGATALLGRRARLGARLEDR